MAGKLVLASHAAWPSSSARYHMACSGVNSWHKNCTSIENNIKAVRNTIIRSHIKEDLFVNKAITSKLPIQSCKIIVFYHDGP
jgi:dTDP-4-dehydrorhamnose reductase